MHHVRYDGNTSELSVVQGDAQCSMLVLMEPGQSGCRPEVSIAG